MKRASKMVGSVFLLGLSLASCQSEPGMDLAALCAADETKAGIKDLVISDFRRDFEGELRFANDVASQLTFDLQRPIATNVDGTIGRTDCEARAVFTISPALGEQFDRESELLADIGYSVQETADKAEKVYRASGYEKMLEQLLSGAAKLQDEASSSDKEQGPALATSSATEATPEAEDAVPAIADANKAKRCFALWKERNSIFAAAGYCFKTEKAIAAFGKRCYPPYGKLSKEEQDIVSKLRAQERQYNCNG